MTDYYTISAAAKEAGITIHQARKYFRFGLVRSVGRTSRGGYRLNEAGVRRLRFAGLATNVGLPLRDVTPLLSELDRGPEPDPERVAALSESLEQQLHRQGTAVAEFERLLHRICDRRRC